METFRAGQHPCRLTQARKPLGVGSSVCGYHLSCEGDLSESINGALELVQSSFYDRQKKVHLPV